MQPPYRGFGREVPASAVAADTPVEERREPFPRAVLAGRPGFAEAAGPVRRSGDEGKRREAVTGDAVRGRRQTRRGGNRGAAGRIRASSARAGPSGGGNRIRPPIPFGAMIAAASYGRRRRARVWDSAGGVEGRTAVCVCATGCVCLGSGRGRLVPGT